MRKWEVVRHFFRSNRKQVVAVFLTEEQAQRWCSDPETSSSTCKGKVGRARTRRSGPWFDGYREVK